MHHPNLVNKPRVPDDDLLVSVTNALDAGWDTDTVAAEVELKYQSLLTRLDRMGTQPALKQRLLARRQREWDDRRAAGTIDYARKRCAHGAWSSTGACEHDMMGRYGTIAPAA